jgi:DNA-binding NarL/FixJ family response regulator
MFKSEGGIFYDFRFRAIFQKIEENTITIVKLLMAGKTIKEISEELKISPKKVEKIEEKFESN